MTEEQAEYNANKHVSEQAGEYFTRSGTIAFKRMYVDVMGDVVGALWLSQLNYWMPKGKRRDGYIYKSYKEWEEETGLSQYQVKRCADKAEELGIIERKLKKANNAPTIHYKLNQSKLTCMMNSIIEKLNNPLSRNLTNQDYQETSQSLTETTTQTTTDSSKPEKNADDILGKDITERSEEIKENKPKRMTKEQLEMAALGIGEKDPLEGYPVDVKELLSPFIELFGRVAIPKKKSDWIATVREEWIPLGLKPSTVREMYKHCQESEMSISRPGSITWAYDKIRSEPDVIPQGDYRRAK